MLPSFEQFQLLVKRLHWPFVAMFCFAWVSAPDAMFLAEARDQLGYPLAIRGRQERPILIASAVVVD
jgi:hypothetical protein